MLFFNGATCAIYNFFTRYWLDPSKELCTFILVLTTTTPMTSLAELARLKSIALAEDAKNLGGFNGSQYKAWCDYNDALNACSNAHIAEFKKAQDADRKAKFALWFNQQVALRKNA